MDTITFDKIKKLKIHELLQLEPSTIILRVHKTWLYKFYKAIQNPQTQDIVGWQLVNSEFVKED